MRVLHSLCFATLFLAVQGHAAVQITVTTLNDENGENMQACSLREAIMAVNLHQPYGGCRAGDRYLTNIVQLANETYRLTRGELVVSAAVTIAGADTNVATLKDPISRLKPLRLPPSITRQGGRVGTRIDAGHNSRLFNSTSASPALTLNNLVLTNGRSTLGGAILAGGQINLNNTILTGNEALADPTSVSITGAGGAIYLSGRDARLVSADSTLSNNKADRGAAFAMSCTDHLNPVTRVIDILRSTVSGNGSADAISVIDGCGSLELKVDASTIAQNTVKSNGGVINLVDNIDRVSQLTMTQATVVENSGGPALAYGNVGDLIITASLIAFNESGCQDKSTVTPRYNGRKQGAYNVFEKCPFTYETTTPANIIDVDLGTKSDASFETELNPLANYGGYTRSYLPKLSSKYLLNRGQLPEDCTRVDQRASNSHDTLNNGAADRCDVGAVERRVATAAFDRTSTRINSDNSNRVAEENVLANDIPSETDQAYPEDMPATEIGLRGNIKKDDTGHYLLTLTDNAGGHCTIADPADAEALPLVRFENNGVPSPDGDAILCKYRFTDTNNQLSTEGIIRFRIVNKPPVAVADTYVLPSGSPGVLMNLTANDSDKDDGTYGALCTASDTNCSGHYIRIIKAPVTGELEPELSGSCPDTDDTNKYVCYGGTIYYRTKNILSPFNDKFTYVVYDVEHAISEETTVTVINQTGASEYDENSGAAKSGALGLWGLFGLAGLAFYRRFRN